MMKNDLAKPFEKESSHIELKCRFLRYQGIILKNNFKYFDSFEKLSKCLELKGLSLIKLSLEKTNSINQTLTLKNIEQAYNYDTDKKLELIEDLIEIGSLEFDKENYSNAKEFFESALKLFDTLENLEKVKHAQTRNNIEINQLAVKLKISSQTELKTILKSEREKISKDPPKFNEVKPREALKFLVFAELFERFSYFNKAEKLYRSYKSLLLQMNTYKGNHNFIKATILRANLLAKFGIYDKAIPDLKESQKMCEKLQGTSEILFENPLLIEAHLGLAVVYKNLFDRVKASKIYNFLLNSYLKIAGVEEIEQVANEKFVLISKFGLFCLQYSDFLLYSIDLDKSKLYHAIAYDIFSTLFNFKVDSEKFNLLKLSLIKGFISLNKGNLNEAEQEFQSGINLFPENFEGNDGLCIYSSDMGLLLIYKGICNRMFYETESVNQNRDIQKRTFKQYFTKGKQIIEEIYPSEHYSVSKSTILGEILLLDDTNFSEISEAEKLRSSSANFGKVTYPYEATGRKENLKMELNAILLCFEKYAMNNAYNQSKKLEVKNKVLKFQEFINKSLANI